MKLFQGKTRVTSTAAGASDPAAGVARRNVVLGAGAVGAAAIAAHGLQRGADVAATAPVAAAASAEAGDGYQLTQHVLRYYETAKV